jgi:hypothetical protein
MEERRPKKLLDQVRDATLSGPRIPIVKQLGDMMVFRTAASGSRDAIRP